uniref:toprim domain-containing protein n=1 Tax=Myroides sp. N17-2 TaxID=2030799 RepID=UPI0011811E99
LLSNSLHENTLFLVCSSIYYFRQTYYLTLDDEICSWSGEYLKIARKYCVELLYRLNDKTYYGIGFKNDSEGYEIRNKYVKMCLGTKAPSYFNNNSSQIVLFESWSDFLSFLTLYPKAERHYDYLILNSVGTLHNVLINETNNYLYKCTNGASDICIKNTLYKELKYDIIICCFDNDDAGNKTTEKVKNTFPNRVKDGRYLYPNHKDLNDFINTHVINV